jgi:putative transposase
MCWQKILKHSRRRTAQVAESTLRCRSRREPSTVLRLRIREITQVRVGYGYRKIRVLSKREGWNVGKKLAGCIEKEGLTLRYKPRRRRCAATNRRASQVTATFETPLNA